MDRESKAALFTFLYFLILAAPWLYSYNRQVFNAIVFLALGALGLLLAITIFALIFTYFHSLLDR
jgi:uncharacterized protein YybS (DUF2232 family)